MRYMTTDTLIPSMKVSFPRKIMLRTLSDVTVNAYGEPVLHFTDGYKMVTSWDASHIVVG